MTSEKPYVLDAFALLAFFQAEAGGLQVRGLIERAERGEVTLSMTTVNLGEVIYKTERQYGLERAREVLGKVTEYPITLVDVDLELAIAAARFKARKRMSFADCLAAALAQRLDAAVLTSDADFQMVEHEIGVEWLPT